MPVLQVRTLLVQIAKFITEVEKKTFKEEIYPQVQTMFECMALI